MHLDEATPHLHIDYIPVAHGYKKEKAAKEVLAKHDLRAETFKMISKEVAAETKSMKKEQSSGSYKKE